MEYVKKKAQAAIAYLMNYTWMLAAVIMVGGSLFLLYSGQESTQQVSGFNNNIVNVESVQVLENQATLQASTMNNVDLTEIILEDDDNEVRIPLRDSVSGSDLIEVCGVKESDSENVDVTLLYDKDGLEGLSTTGTLHNTELSDCIVDVTITLLDQARNQQTSEYSIPIGKDLYLYSVEGPPGLVGRINILNNPDEFDDKKDLDVEVQGRSQPRENHNYAMISIEEEGVRKDLYENFLISESGSLNVTIDGKETIIDLDQHQTKELNMGGVTTLEPFSCTITITGCAR